MHPSFALMSHCAPTQSNKWMDDGPSTKLSSNHKSNFSIYAMH